MSPLVLGHCPYHGGRMASKKGKTANQPGEPVSCARHLSPRLKVWRRALSALSELPPRGESARREVAEGDVCLASRSAYFDFYTWVVIHGEGDAAVEGDLQEMFEQSLAA